MLHTTYNRIRRYATGDPIGMCRYGSTKPRELDQYREQILELLKNNVPIKQAQKIITDMGYMGKRTAFGEYCRNLVKELNIPYTPRKNAVGVTIKAKDIFVPYRYISRSDLLQSIWTDGDVDQSDIDYIEEQFPRLREIHRCIRDFRQIYEKKDLDLLDRFIKTYSVSDINPIKSFAHGLSMDLNAVKNSVISDLNNGYVEGDNNKIKMIKRLMYGRAKLDLLRVKVVFAR